MQKLTPAFGSAGGAETAPPPAFASLKLQDFAKTGQEMVQSSQQLENAPDAAAVADKRGPAKTDTMPAPGVDA
ncbi:MAG: hypothetical protein IT558_04365 [Alphaproteobacteria bacterium]|nr:hypothetical protein [Alphaproteobacteria bacterium]